LVWEDENGAKIINKGLTLKPLPIFLLCNQTWA